MTAASMPDVIVFRGSCMVPGLVSLPDTPSTKMARSGSTASGTVSLDEPQPVNIAKDITIADGAFQSLMRRILALRAGTSKWHLDFAPQPTQSYFVVMSVRPADVGCVDECCPVSLHINLIASTKS